MTDKVYFKSSPEALGKLQVFLPANHHFSLNHHQSQIPKVPICCQALGPLFRALFLRLTPTCGLSTAWQPRQQQSKITGARLLQRRGSQHHRISRHFWLFIKGTATPRPPKYRRLHRVLPTTATTMQRFFHRAQPQRPPRSHRLCSTRPPTRTTWLPRPPWHPATWPNFRERCTSSSSSNNNNNLPKTKTSLRLQHRSLAIIRGKGRELTKAALQ